MAGLLSDALPAWEEMAAQADAADLLRRNGCLYLYRRSGALPAAPRKLTSQATALEVAVAPRADDPLGANSRPHSTSRKSAPLRKLLM
ncbi:hypothetical protein [Mesorhizobium sp. B2-3-5]|uniref:hypothetical protein n=1 Tax=Mesorhizobium sp. B2-3-5 TaxID=2589958 RepID=UPI00112A1D42|nr:hypothetical protein [Mesorhizobium sp. B2-3-5]TPM16309.1 hypothetical protein FJ958_29355 [Mesorhizobium sp. B2-3-5]